MADDVEVYLAYQNKLKKALGLTSVTAEMRFFGVSGVTVSDLQAAELQVKAAEKASSGVDTAVGAVTQRAGAQSAGTR